MNQIIDLNSATNNIFTINGTTPSVDVNNATNNFINVNGNNDQFTYRFQSGPQVEIRGNSGRTYRVEFCDSLTNKVIFADEIKSNYYSKCHIEYFVNWHIKVTDLTTNVLVQEFRYKPMSNVVIVFESSALGDTICWVPVVEEFRKKHNVEVYCSTFHNQLFSETYPNIHWINRGTAIPETRCVYRIGWFGKGEPNHKNPRDCRTIPLQQVATDILGIDPVEEFRPKLTRDKRPPLYNNSKYVVISTVSTAQAKHWNLPNGWQDLVNWLNSKGYSVVNVGREPNKLTGVVDMCNIKPIMDIVNLIQHCKFFIGLGSGLSWMAWALDKKSVMISGFSADWCEFQKDNYRVINKNVCNSCFNDPKHWFDKGNWNWCPRNENTRDHFICSKAISTQMVFDKISELESDLNQVLS